ncbi:helix-turn-helix domain-containing protein [Treponema socranskii]|uniref:helix-turn-helix domain-containing protein n=1 Tax=Treponema socranskii TaxID=53419 RepID=UPI0028ED06E4|nr:helix-turn-helix domain-containing protein [Treponema socranskii]
MNKTDLGASLPQDQFELLSRAEACKFLHISQSMLDAHLKIPKVRIGRKVLYTKASLIKFINETKTDE